MSSPPEERRAERRALRARALRRRRLRLGLVLVVVAVVIALVAGGGSKRTASKTGARGATASTAAKTVRVSVAATGQLPSAVQDAAAAPLGAGGALVMGGLETGESSVTDVVQVQGAGARTVGSLPTALHDACAAALGGTCTSSAAVNRRPSRRS